MTSKNYTIILRCPDLEGVNDSFIYKCSASNARAAAEFVFQVAAADLKKSVDDLLLVATFEGHHDDLSNG